MKYPFNYPITFSIFASITLTLIFPSNQATVSETPRDHVLLITIDDLNDDRVKR